MGTGKVLGEKMLTLHAEQYLDFVDLIKVFCWEIQNPAMAKETK